MKKTLLSACLFMLVAALATVSYAQNAGQRPGRQGMGPGMGPGGFDREAMQQRMAQMMQEQLEITAEEWAVVGPRLTKVMTLNRDASGMGGMGRMFGGRMGAGRGPRDGQPAGGPEGRRGRNAQEGENEDVSAVQKASDELSDILENAAATPDEIKAKLTALRTAREKARQDLIKAQEELKEVLSLKQEAKLVMFGMLD